MIRLTTANGDTLEYLDGESLCAECGHPLVCHDGKGPGRCEFPWDGLDNWGKPDGCLCGSGDA